jgi:hypothetical protein
MHVGPQAPAQISSMSSSTTALPKARCEDIKSLASATLDLPPSCIEFCWDRPEFFVVGSYHLDETIRDQPASDVDGKPSHQKENSFPENDVHDWGGEDYAEPEPEGKIHVDVDKGNGQATEDVDVDENGEN